MENVEFLLSTTSVPGDVRFSYTHDDFSSHTVDSKILREGSGDRNPCLQWGDSHRMKFPGNSTLLNDFLAAIKVNPKGNDILLESGQYKRRRFYA